VRTLEEDAAPDAGTSTLKAWDPAAQKLAWGKPNPGVWNSGTVTTAGNLVFQGQADGRLLAYAADDGEVLWSQNLGLGITAPPAGMPRFAEYSDGDLEALRHYIRKKAEE
jgi:quinohemoprotein ethanol dehydrogenase